MTKKLITMLSMALLSTSCSLEAKKNLKPELKLVYGQKVTYHSDFYGDMCCEAEKKYNLSNLNIDYEITCRHELGDGTVFYYTYNINENSPITLGCGKKD